ncbi:SGNH/GDSL hydrolase family protein [Sphingomonas sp. BIUV-7]|uniref:SGNH/GDSL hydrolase family protein n=1 Tax=Sphingomonas natans TaxID=3063330 RepID=A0ABT8Y865_9SPHN|nr:SGNH/GDSL hydrolase family protein [Sphingomonas sp. BIUV-7]MDO6414512.1 SGNH/GDSL hydrolase family protein [Sphingomonas sp. BIUV-7]
MAMILVRTICCLGLAALLLAGGVAALLWWQARRVPIGQADYVALGSSFAAGIGLGPRAPRSPLVCLRTTNGYPQQLARMRGLSLVDVTCSGATSTHVLAGGQIFLGPQIDAITRKTRLVTMTIGGNDIGYVGDLSLAAARRQRSLTGWLARAATRAPRLDRARDYDGVRVRMVAIIRAIRKRAPAATIIVLSYPQILPESGTCERLALAEGDVATMRNVGDRLVAATRAAAMQAGAEFIDLQQLGGAHDACAPDPWVNGWRDAAKTPFHPTLAGATAAAQAIAALLDARAGPARDR